MLVGTGVSLGGGKRRGGVPRRYKGGRRKGSARRFSLKVSPAFARQVKAVVKPESKYLYTSIHRSLVELANPFVESLDDMKQGSGVSLRIGNSVSPTVIYGQMTLVGVHLGDGLHDVSAVRMVLLQYHDDQSESPFDASIVLENSATPGGPFKVTSKGRFTVVWSKFLNIVNRRDNSQFSKTCPVQVNVKKYRDPLYDAAVAKKHHYWMCVFTDANSVGGWFVEVRQQLQLRYTDS